jgi:hypothetical protein
MLVGRQLLNVSGDSDSLFKVESAREVRLKADTTYVIGHYVRH